MDISPGIIILVLILAAVVYFGLKNKPKVMHTIADLRDDGRLNGSVGQPAAVVDHAQIVTAALQGAAAVTAAAQPQSAPIAPPAPARAAQFMRLEDVHDQAGLDAYRAHLARTNPTLLAYIPTVYTPPKAPVDMGPGRARVQLPEPPAALAWQNGASVIAAARANVSYVVEAPAGRGYMLVGGEGGYDATFTPGAVGAGGTRIADASGRFTFAVDKDCDVIFDPV